MKTNQELFVEQIMLNPEYNSNVSGDVSAPSGYFGYMFFPHPEDEEMGEYTCDTKEDDEEYENAPRIPEEFFGHYVIAIQCEDGSASYNVLTKEYLEDIGEDLTEDDPHELAEQIAETWFEAQEQRYSDWLGYDDDDDKTEPESFKTVLYAVATNIWSITQESVLYSDYEQARHDANMASEYEDADEKYSVFEVDAVIQLDTAIPST